MNIAVLGASGYLGSHLCRALSKSNNVYALVRQSSASLARLDMLDINIINLGQNALEDLFDRINIDVVINTITCYGRAGESYEKMAEANTRFPYHVFELSNVSGSKLFLNAGTSLPSSLNDYAHSKAKFIDLAANYKSPKAKFVNIGLEHFYGFADNANKFTSYIFEGCVAGKELNLTSGCQRRDFIHIDDVVSGFEMVIGNFDRLKHGEYVSLGTGVAPTIKEFVCELNQQCGSRAKLNFGAVDLRSGEVMESCADLSIMKSMGWSPRYSYIDGIQEVLKHYKAA